MTEKFRGDQIGSLLRPETLLAARRGHDAGEVTDADCARPRTRRSLAVRGRRRRGSRATDGEFRRRDFRSGFAQAVDGIEMSAWDMPWHSAEGTTRLRSIAFTATGRLRQRERLAGGEVAFVRSLDGHAGQGDADRAGVPRGPVLEGRGHGCDYSSREEFAAEVAAITRGEIRR